MPSIEELQSAVTQSLEAAVDSMRFAGQLMARNTAQQQEIERLRGLLSNPAIDEYLDAGGVAAQRKGERAVDCCSVAKEILDWLEESNWLASCDSKPGARAWRASKLLGEYFDLPDGIAAILRRHLEPQGEPHERDEVPVRDSAVLEPGVSVEPGVSGASAATAPQRERVEVACGDGRSVESVQAVAAQAVAPASPVRAEEPDADLSLRLLFEAAVMGCNDTAVLDTGTFSQLRDAVEAEFAALRKQVVEGGRDTRRLDWLGTEVNFSLVDIVGVSKGSGLFNSNRQGTMRTLREALDAAMAATPEPKEPANG